MDDMGTHPGIDLRKAAVRAPEDGYRAHRWIYCVAPVAPQPRFAPPQPSVGISCAEKGRSGIWKIPVHLKRKA